MKIKEDKRTSVMSVDKESQKKHPFSRNSTI
jgi:hypothetical protein